MLIIQLWEGKIEERKYKSLTLHRVFHGIRLLRLIKIGCRETINFFCPLFKVHLRAVDNFFMLAQLRFILSVTPMFLLCCSYVALI